MAGEGGSFMGTRIEIDRERRDGVEGCRLYAQIAQLPVQSFLCLILFCLVI